VTNKSDSKTLLNLQHTHRGSQTQKVDPYNTHTELLASLRLHLCRQGDGRTAVVVSIFIELEPQRKMDLRNVIFTPFLLPVSPEYIPSIE
jgi:hypothetical protein